MAEQETNQTREALAAYAHEAWTGWMKYMFSKCEHTADHQVVIPDSLFRRWMRQMNTPYSDLPESEKTSDRKEADQMLAITGHEALADAAQKAIEALELWPETDWGWREREVYDLLSAALDKARPAPEPYTLNPDP